MKENIARGALTALLTGAAVYFHALLGPLIVLLIVMMVDYITGIAQAWVGHTLSSRVGLVGIVKKVGYLFAVAVAIVVDYVIQTAMAGAGVELGSTFLFGMLVTVWLILNECISILENLGELGVPLPGFLMSIVKRLKTSTETKGDEAAAETNTEGENTSDLSQHPPDKNANKDANTEELY